MRMDGKRIALVLFAVSVCAVSGVIGQGDKITSGIVESAEKIIGLVFTPAERDSMIDDLSLNVDSYERVRGVVLDNSVPPALGFDPLPVGWKPPVKRSRFDLGRARAGVVPSKPQDLAFYTVRDLAELIRTRKITSTELTQLYLERLKKYGPKLECVITLTEERALEQAARADEEIAAGRYRGLLHGIPYGAKDLLAVEGYRTTWGAMPYKDQVIDEDATVVRKLDEAGAVLVAKLTVGALAWGDVWYGGMTRNPWNLEEGSSGSSAGSASATAAGLVPFAIGTETWGSIVSPSTRCGSDGAPPDVRAGEPDGGDGARWSMDKIGPICRTRRGLRDRVRRDPRSGRDRRSRDRCAVRLQATRRSQNGSASGSSRRSSRRTTRTRANDEATLRSSRARARARSRRAPRLSGRVARVHPERRGGRRVRRAHALGPRRSHGAADQERLAERLPGVAVHSRGRVHSGEPRALHAHPGDGEDLGVDVYVAPSFGGTICCSRISRGTRASFCRTDSTRREARRASRSWGGSSTRGRFSPSPRRIRTRRDFT